jgi:carbamoyl-phosphate synthase large subunit
MPKRTDIKSILVIGAGPIVIGQACEFDYSGVQACKALKDEGYRVILVNSNPATIMTDPGPGRRDLHRADHARHGRQDHREGAARRHPADDGRPDRAQHGDGAASRRPAGQVRRRADRRQCRGDRQGRGPAAVPRRHDQDRARIAQERGRAQSRGGGQRDRAVGLPAIIRPSFTLGGTGGGIAYNRDEYFEIVQGGIDASPVGEVLVEESVLGWKEYEMEVVRDRHDNCIIICSIENVDPMGIHTGDSVTVAPALTLTDKEYQIMRNASIACLREIGVDTGGSNVQFAIDPRPAAWW